MRKEFAIQLHAQMKVNPDIFLITGDMGYGILDHIKQDFPERFLNIGAAEVCMVSVAVGLALSGKTAICYSITPFLLFRPFETIRTYVNHENIPVILVGSGRGNDYAHDGFSHDASDDYIMSHFHNIRIINGESFNLHNIIESNRPTYLNLKR